MKNQVGFIAFFLLGCSLITTRAQPQGPPKPSFNGAIAKLFGDNPNFTATMELHYTRSSGGEMVVPGKMAGAENKTRCDMDLSNLQGGNMTPRTLAQMKQMGMDAMTSITRLDKKTVYLIYPNMKAYIESPIPDSEATVENYKVETNRLGNETIGGHDCVKNNVTVTGSDGVAHKSTVWNASDLKQFPLKIEMPSDNGDVMTMRFSDVKLTKPDSSQFEPPTDFTKYDTVMNMMMSRFRAGRPPQ